MACAFLKLDQVERAAQLAAAIFRYNQSEAYVRAVLAWADAYAHKPVPTAGLPAGAPDDALSLASMPPGASLTAPAAATPLPPSSPPPPAASSPTPAPPRARRLDLSLQHQRQLRHRHNHHRHSRRRHAADDETDTTGVQLGPASTATEFTLSRYHQQPPDNHQFVSEWFAPLD